MNIPKTINKSLRPSISPPLANARSQPKGPKILTCLSQDQVAKERALPGHMPPLASASDTGDGHVVSTQHDIGVREPSRSHPPSLSGEGLKSGSPRAESRPSGGLATRPRGRTHEAGPALQSWFGGERMAADFGNWQTRHHPVVRRIFWSSFFANPSPWMVFITSSISFLSNCELKLFLHTSRVNHEKRCLSVSSTKVPTTYLPTYLPT
ncbi:hypothetical protein LX36DRAFT_449056 [Colletotrichum falcatum]|nr:hypothetical protein LX36DRAFT_449056 [Colletotrichum falcatum]